MRKYQQRKQRRTGIPGGVILLVAVGALALISVHDVAEAAIPCEWLQPPRRRPKPPKHSPKPPPAAMASASSSTNIAGETTMFRASEATGVHSAPSSFMDNLVGPGTKGARIPLQGSTTLGTQGSLVGENALSAGLSPSSASGPSVRANAEGAGSATVDLSNGHVVESQTDFELPSSAGVPWRHHRTFNGSGSDTSRTEGWNWRSQYWATLQVDSPPYGDVTITLDDYNTLQFTSQGGGSWTPPDQTAYKLTYDGGASAHHYILRTPNFVNLYFHDSTVSPVAKRGRLKYIYDQHDRGLSFSYDSNGELTTVDDADAHRARYIYRTSAPNEDGLEQVKIFRSQTETDANLVGKIDFTYDNDSTPGDLVKVVVRSRATNDAEGELSIVSTTMYRTWSGSWTESNPGKDRSLRFIVRPENYERLLVAYGSDPQGAPDSTIADFADVQIEYQPNLWRVGKVTERGGACGECGVRDTLYSWSGPVGTSTYDEVRLHAQVDLDNGARVYVDSNTVGDVINWVYIDDPSAQPPREWRYRFKYGIGTSDNGRLVATYGPQTVTNYDPTTRTTQLSTTLGLVHGYVYGTSFPETGLLKQARYSLGTTGAWSTLYYYHYNINGECILLTEYGPANTIGGFPFTIGNTGLEYTVHDDGTGQPHVQLKNITTSQPQVAATQNGPNVRPKIETYYDTKGLLRWTKEPSGAVNYYGYDDGVNGSGQQDFVVLDVNTTTLPTGVRADWGKSPVPFTRYSSLPSAQNATTTTQLDFLGRTRKTTDADGVVTFYAYTQEGTREVTHVYDGWDGVDKTVEPTKVYFYDKSGRLSETKQIRSGKSLVSSGDPVGVESYSNDDLVSWTKKSYALSGQLEWSREYHDIPSSGEGSAFSNYYETSYKYDAAGFREYEIEQMASGSPYATEQVSRYIHDVTGHLVETQAGVSDSSHNIHVGPDQQNPWSFLKTTERRYYDDPDAAVAGGTVDSDLENGVGPGLLSWVEAFHSDSGSTRTRYGYDPRERLTLTVPPLPPYSLRQYDDQGKVVGTAAYTSVASLTELSNPSTADSSNRVSWTTIAYDNADMPYQTKAYDDPSATTPANALITNYFYDLNGRVVATDPPNSGVRFVKFDGAGRQVESFSGTQFASSNYDSNGQFLYPGNDSGIVEHDAFEYTPAGRLTKVVSDELNHNDPDGMDFSANDDYIRTYAYSWYDKAGRLVDHVDFGTNDSAGWKYNGTSLPAYDSDGSTAGDQPPARSDTALRTTYAFDEAGRIQRITDPAGKESYSSYDDLGRTVYQDAGYGSADVLRTEFQYDGLSNNARYIADPGADNALSNGVWTCVGTDQDQVTEYVFADPLDASLVTEIRYPIGDGTVATANTDKERATYHYDGLLKDYTDQNGTKHDFLYDNRRRQTVDMVTVGSYTGGVVDPDIRAISWSYDSQGRVELITSHAMNPPDTTNYEDVRNQVKYIYNAAGRLIKEEQNEANVVISGISLGVEHGYSTDYNTGGGTFNRQAWFRFPSSNYTDSAARRIWYGYTHSGGTGTFQDTINDVFSRVGQIARKHTTQDQIGDLLAEYDFNGLGRMVRRVHDEDTGKYGNDTILNVGHPVSGNYQGFDRFGRAIQLEHTDMAGGPYLGRAHGYDRNGNRTFNKDTVYKAESLAFNYDARDRLNNAGSSTAVKRGILDSNNAIYASTLSENLTLDRLGNYFQGSGGIAINSTTVNVAHGTTSNPPNATNEIKRIDQPNPAAPATLIDEPFGSSLNSVWIQQKGTWSTVDSGGGDYELKVDSLTSGEAVALLDAELDIEHYQFTVKFPTGSSSGKAGFVFAHDGGNSYYAVAINRAANQLSIYNVVNGTWTPVYARPFYLQDPVECTYTVIRRQKNISYYTACDPGWVIVAYLSSDLDTGNIGFYSNVAGATFDDLKVFSSTARDPIRPDLVGSADAAVTSRGLELTTRPAELFVPGSYGIVDRFSDDDYMVEATVNLEGTSVVSIPFQFVDVNNTFWAQAHRYNGSSVVYLYVYQLFEGSRTNFYAQSTSVAVPNPVTLKMKRQGSVVSFYLGDLTFSMSNNNMPSGSVGAWTTSTAGLSRLKIGYDSNNNNALDQTEWILIDNDFSSTTLTLDDDHTNGTNDSWDPAGNLVDDGRFRYTYDGWNRLVKVKASKGENIVIQTAEYDGLGRRTKKVVTNSAPYDKTEVYFYDGQRIVETRDGSGNVVNQFIHGTRYIDELVMMRAMGKGDLYVHQDANWNVIGLTDLGGRLVERYVYTPYGEVMVHQETSYGDRDGDKDVDITDKGGPTACPGTVGGTCRIMDFDFDGDYDADDRDEYWPALKKFYMRHPGRLASQVGQPFGHQGLLYDPEISTYQNRARQYSPSLRRFIQRDPLEYADGPSQYLYAFSNPLNYVDPSGLSGGSTGGGTVALGEALAGWIAKIKAAIAAGNIAAASEAARQAAAIVALLMGEQAAIDFLRKWDEAIREAQRTKKPPEKDPWPWWYTERDDKSKDKDVPSTRKPNPDGSEKDHGKNLDELERRQKQRREWEKRQDGEGKDNKPPPVIEGTGKSKKDTQNDLERERREYNERSKNRRKPPECP